MEFSKKIFWITFFSIAMGYLESAVVVYLRELYYPAGFSFPLQPIEASVAITEIGREAATLIMLLSIGFLAGRNISERFTWFIYSFAVWDIFYYIFLFFLLGWPPSLFTWDILFLIPVTWVGPVLAPVILSLNMILLALLILFNNNRNTHQAIHGRTWGLLILGSLICILSFTIDYSQYMLNEYSIQDIFGMREKQALFELSQKYVPETFDWWIFFLGEFFILGGIGYYIRANRLNA